MLNVIGRIAIYVLVAGFGFEIGRRSQAIVMDKELEKKREALIAYRDELVEIAEHLEQKDTEIRHKWQKMVDDFSKYQAAMNPENASTWTEADDIYLNSWKSAEK